MKISTVDNQNFNGRVCVVGQRKQKELKFIVQELNAMKIIRNSDYNFYIAYGTDYLAIKGACVKVLARLDGHKRTDGFKIADYNQLYEQGENATLNVGSIASAIKRTLNSVF